MVENKTKATEASVDSFINSLPEPRRGDAKPLVKLMESVSRQKPRMWGSSIVGFGTYHYRHDSGREGEYAASLFLTTQDGERCLQHGFGRYGFAGQARQT